ncbi:hypothetical protein EJD97_012681 [Solanum chilense]|uniref:Uncharacterized protein n=1 Tax=Solanum chilense TaxID=4083 RepID=A0A6N2AIT1_SOLCI|nr:hypothetical protein EJD97_012681 [Solanum chilense]
MCCCGVFVIQVRRVIVVQFDPVSVLLAFILCVGALVVCAVSYKLLITEYQLGLFNALFGSGEFGVYRFRIISEFELSVARVRFSCLFGLV